MINKFTIHNYKSFAKKAELKLNCQPINIIEGPTNSGKTNLLNAFATFKDLLTNPTEAITDALPHITHWYNNPQDSTSFKLEFILNNQTYKFNISYTDTEILKEELFINDQPFYQRDHQTYKIDPQIVKDHGLNLNWLRPNRLLFDLLQYNNEPTTIEILHYINNFTFNSDLQANSNQLYQSLTKTKIKNELLKALQYIKPTITDITITKSTNLVYNPDLIYQPYYADLIKQNKHDNYQIWLTVNDFDQPLTAQSKTFQTYTLLALSLINDNLTNNHHTYFLDNFANNMNAKYLKYLAKLFNQYTITNSSNEKQLILVTNNTLLTNNLDYNHYNVTLNPKTHLASTISHDYKLII